MGQGLPCCHPRSVLPFLIRNRTLLTFRGAKQPETTRHFMASAAAKHGYGTAGRPLAGSLPVATCAYSGSPVPVSSRLLARVEGTDALAPYWTLRWGLLRRTRETEYSGNDSTQPPHQPTANIPTAWMWGRNQLPSG